MITISNNSGHDLKLDDDVLDTICEKIDIAENWCGKINLRMSVLGADRARRDIKANPVSGQVNRSIEELHNRISDEIWPILLMYLTPEQVEWHKRQDPFGEDVAKRFSSAGFDIEESCKCYALGRYTACVMHLMRVVELGMRALAVELDVPQGFNPSWDGILKKIGDQLELKRNQRNPDFLVNEAFYDDAARHIRSYQRARNRTQHADKKYTQEEAKRIYDAVCEVMQHLAKNLDEVPMPENLRVVSVTTTTATIAWDQPETVKKLKTK